MLVDLQRNMQELKDKGGRENTEIKHSLEVLKSRLDEVQEAINGIEIREQEYREADVERDKRISRNETILRELLHSLCVGCFILCSFVTNPKGTIYTL